VTDWQPFIATVARTVKFSVRRRTEQFSSKVMVDRTLRAPPPDTRVTPCTMDSSRLGARCSLGHDATTAAPFSLGGGVQVHHRQAPARTECCRWRRQRHAEVRPRTQPAPARRAALAGRSSVGAVQAVCNGPSMSATQGTTVHFSFFVFLAYTEH